MCKFLNIRIKFVIYKKYFSLFNNYSYDFVMMNHFLLFMI